MDGNSHFKSVWISDFHLGTIECKSIELCEFLNSIKCDNLFLVGDVIDGWRLRHKFYFPQSHMDVIKKILSMSKEGTNVYYITGNHDDFLCEYTNDEDLFVGNILIIDKFEYNSISGKKLMIIHGDQYDVAARYHKFLTVLGDYGYTFLTFINIIFNFFRRKFGLSYWSLSALLKSKVSGAVRFIRDFENSVICECKRLNFDGAICGHIHHPEIRLIDNKIYMNSGDWIENCSALIENHDGTFEIYKYDKAKI